MKDGSDPVEHMVVRFLHIVRNLVFKGQHTLHIHVSGACDEVLFIGVLPCQLKTDEMTAVVEISPVHIVIGNRMPTGGLYLTDGASLLGGHQLRADVGVGYPAAVQPIQRRVGLKGLGGEVRGIKIRDIVLENHIGLVCIWGDGVQLIANYLGGRSGSWGNLREKRAARQLEADQHPCQ